MFLLWLLCTLPAAALAQAPSVAFFYGANPPLSDLQAFDIAVVEPEHVSNPRSHARVAQDGVHELFAYVSLGEVQPSRAYYRDLPAGVLRTDNPAWGSKVIDQAAPGWSEFFLTRVIEPLWQQGWRGFFLDTLDSYQLFAGSDAERARQTGAMIATLREFKRRHPQARLMLNRGFELLPEIAPITFAVAAESLYQGFDAAKNRYVTVPPADRAWLLGQMTTAHERYHLPVVSIEYIAPDNPAARERARATAALVRSHGFVPWVADGGLVSMGVGSIEVLPRTVLVLVDNVNLDLHYTSAQQMLGMPLNYLGLRYEFVDLRTEALPDGILAGRYAGIVSWLDSGLDHPKLAAWFQRRVGEGMRIAVFDTFGFALDAGNAGPLGLRVLPATPPKKLTIAARDQALLDFEVVALPDRAAFLPVQLVAGGGRSLLGLQDSGSGPVFEAVALTKWGGFALAPFTYRTLPTLNQNRWIVQPIKFLQAALQLPDLPVPDVTTEGGRRMVMAHVDGDGFASRAELPGAPFASDIMARDFLAHYQIPSAVSVIEGELSSTGVYKELSAQLEPIAKRIFALPAVEAASHSYSHPFNWAKAMQLGDTQDDGAVDKSYGLPLPGYRFNLQREVQGSIDYINTRLMPPNKKATLFLWSGNCVVPEPGITETVRSGLLNMNGGDTVITNSNNSWTAIAAQGVRKSGAYQVFAPNQNENVYTNNWTGPFYGFERVIETFKLTGAPYRFKPVDIYYHVYSASKKASITALHKVYDWASAQPFTRVFPSQYIQKVLDFESTSMARDLASGELLVRTGSALRTLRMAPGAAAPSVVDSSGIAGIAPGPAGDYLTLTSAQARLAATADRGGAVVQVQEVNGGISQFTRSRSGGVEQLQFTVSANERITLTLAQARSCVLKADGKTVPALAGSQRYLVDADARNFTQRSVITVRCAP